MGFIQKLGSLFGAAKVLDSSSNSKATLPTEKHVTITRIFDSSRQKVWEMWTKPEKMAEWFGVPPVAATKETIAIDLHVGGKWRADMMHAHDGSKIPFGGTYLEINPPHKLVFTIENPADPASPEVETVTVTFKDHAGTTEMILHQEGFLPVEQYGDPLQRGYGAFFERMAIYLRTHST